MNDLAPTKFVEQTLTTPFGCTYTSTPSMRAERNWKGEPQLSQRWVSAGQPDLYLPLVSKNK